MPDVPEFDYLIVGGGLAAASAVDGIRDQDPDGSILVLAEEAEPPYHRPPLSKEYLQTPDASRDMLHVKPEGWFESEAGAELELRQPALQLQAREMKVVTARGNQYRGKRILLATGGRPRRLDVPGAGLDAVHTFRTVEDSEAIRDAARDAERAVLVGAGFIGMEISASLTTYDVESVVVERAERVWPRVLPPELSEWMRRVFEEHGVRFRLGTGVEGFAGDGRVEAVRAGDERLACDFAVVGVGIVPNAEIAAEAGLLVSDGIHVDEMGETSHAGVYAAGDVARFPDPFGSGSMRVEHWDHAKEHGKAVGRNMAGAETPYRRLTYFFSDVFDLSLNVLGRPAAAQRLVLRGTPGEGPSIAFGVEDGHVTSAVMVNASKRLDACRALVVGRPAAEEIEDRLADPDVPLDELAGTGDQGGDG